MKKPQKYYFHGFLQKSIHNHWKIQGFSNDISWIFNTFQNLSCHLISIPPPPLKTNFTLNINEFLFCCFSLISKKKYQIKSLFIFKQQFEKRTKSKTLFCLLLFREIFSPLSKYLLFKEFSPRFSYFGVFLCLLET